MPNVSLTAPTDYATELQAIERRRKLAELLSQQSMDPIQSAAPNAPISWTQGLAKILQGYQGGQGEKKADAEAKELAARQQADQSGDVQRLIAALGGQQAKTIQPDPQEAQQSADQGTPQVAPVNIPAMNPQEALQSTLGSMQSPFGQQMGQQVLGQMVSKEMSPPERVDGGDKWLLVKNNVVVGTLPKGVSPDTQAREAGEASRHATPSGGAQLASQTTLQTHATPSGSAVLAERGAADRHATPSGSALAALDNKQPTESQAKAAVFHSQMVSASDVLGKIPGYDPTSGFAQAETRLAGTGVNFAAGPAAQQAKQAQSQWAESFLRFKTGAASTPAEVDLNVKTFFPQIGDKPEVVQQKALARAQAERDIAMAAGNRINPSATVTNPSATPSSAGLTYVGMRPSG